LWLGDNRTRITGMVGSKGSDVAKKGGEMWKALSAKEKQPYEKKAKEQKDAYEKFVATEEGQKALAEKKQAKADEKADKEKIAEARAEKAKEKEDRKNARECKSAVKALAAEKDDKLKKPQSAYWLWLNDNRQNIVKKVGSSNPVDVSKKGGEMWKALAAKEKQPYEKKAKEQKDAYDKYIASPEGAAALKAFKEATQAAKDKFKSKESVAVEDEEEEAEEEDEKKEETSAPKRKAAAEDKVTNKRAKKAAKVAGA